MAVALVEPFDTREIDATLDRWSAEGVAGAMMLASIPDTAALDGLHQMAVRSPIPLFGGVVPGVIHEGRVYRNGTILLGFRSPVRIAVADPLDPHSVAAALDTLQGHKTKTVIAFVDVLSGPQALVYALFRRLGHAVRIVGGGLGRLGQPPQPVVITPTGLVPGRAVLAATPARAHVAIRHGLEAISSPHLVTRSSGSDLATLNWRPALDVYREEIAAHASAPADDDFATLASRYPLVIGRIGAEGIVRDPLVHLADGTLRLAGEIPPYATVQLAHATPHGMLDAARQLREEMAAHATGRDTVGLVIDCVSRALLQGDRFPEELEVLRLPGVRQVGALTIGEIAHAGSDLLHFHNKTCALALLENP